MLAPLKADSASPAWGAFWSESDLDGCTRAFPTEARDRIALGWSRAFAGAGTRGSVLDLACGKGAVLRYAAAAGFAPLKGIDIAPTASLAGGPFDLSGNINAGALPFPDQSFDVVVSQFGVEYAELRKAVDEAARVSRSAVVLLTHAADGVVVVQSREQVAQIDWLDKVRAFARMRTYVESRLPVAADDVEKLAHEIVKQAGGAENVSLLEALYRCASGLRTDPVPLVSLDALEYGMRDHAVRLRQLIRAAPAPYEVEAAAGVLRNKGFEVEIRPEGRGAIPPLVGRWVIARRTGSKS